MKPIRLIGTNFTPESFTAYLQKSDPCFGKHFAKSAPECRACTAPVVVEGKLTLLREVCRAVCSSGEAVPSALRRLSSREVASRLEAGQQPAEIFLEILADADPETHGTEARALLVGRLGYLAQTLGLPIPDVPRTQELLSNVQNS